MGGDPVRCARGPWSVEVRGDEVSDISFDGVLLLRAIRPVVRDRDWNTVPVRVVAQYGGGDGLATTLSFETDGIAYEAVLTLELTDGGLTVDFAGRAVTAFERNRIGLVVLHPATEAGHRVEVHHPDGTVTAGRWPTPISPHQPFREVTGFGWTRQGITAQLDLSGEVFETEDQRNWTDASFKTYGTPLGRPFPVLVRPGEQTRQRASLRVSGRSDRAQPRGPDDQVRIWPEVTGLLPTLSLGAALYPPPLDSPAPSAGSGRYESVLVELAGPEDRWPGLLNAAQEQAAALGAGLDVRLITADPAAVDRGAAALVDRPVIRLGVFDPARHLTTPPLWHALRQAARAHRLAAELVGGTRAHFAELNRGLAELPADLPALTFSLTPQMHAIEVPHLLDSLGAQHTVAANAVRLAAGRSVHIGPVTLARRFNAVATGVPVEAAEDARRGIDALQPTGFAAAWTLASVAALSVEGVAGLCYYETSGPRGILRDDSSPTPAARVLDRLAALRRYPILKVTTPDRVAALAVLAPSGAVEIALANLSPTERTVALQSGSAGRVQPVTLPAWSVTHETVAERQAFDSLLADSRQFRGS